MKSWNDLPPVVLRHVFRLSSVKDARSMASSCKNFFWRWKVWLNSEARTLLISTNPENIACFVAHHEPLSYRVDFASPGILYVLSLTQKGALSRFIAVPVITTECDTPHEWQQSKRRRK